MSKTAVQVEKRNILIIEDNPEDIATYQRYLLQDKDHSYNFFQSESGEDGLTLCRHVSHEVEIDCLLLDYVLPDMDGIEFINELIVQLGSIPFPVIMLTGQGSSQVAKKSINLGIQDYIEKNSITAAALHRVIENAIEKYTMYQNLENKNKEFQKVQEELEKRVKERTAQLLGSNTLLRQEITEKRRAEKSLKHRLKIEEAMGNISRLLLASHVTTDFDKILEILGSTFDVNRVVLAITEHINKNIDYFYEWNDKTVQSVLDKASTDDIDGYSWWKETLTSSGEIVVDDVSLLSDENTEEKERIKTHGVRSLVAMAIKSKEGESIGYLNFANLSRPRKWSDEDLNVLRIVSEMISAFLERKRVKEKLRQSQEYFRSLIEHTSDLVLILNEDKSINYGNQTIEKILGYEPGEIIDKNLTEFIHPTNTNLFDSVFEKIVENDYSHPIEVKIKNKEQGWKILEVLGKKLPYSMESSVNVVLTLHDVTKRKEIEVNLRKSQQFFQSALDSLSALIAVLDENDTIINVNTAWRKFCEEIGANPDNCGIGDKFPEVCNTMFGDYSNSFDRIVKGISDVKNKKFENFYIEFPCTVENRKKWFIIRVTRFEGEEPTRVVVAYEDITKLKEVERELKDSETRMYTILKSAPDGIITIGADDFIKSFNPAAENIFGYGSNEVIGRDVKNLMSSEYKALYNNYLKENISNKKNENINWEIVGTRNDGSFFPLELTISKTYFDNNLVFTWIVRDITERKLAAAKIENIAKELRLFIDTVNVPIFAIDNKYNINEWNQASEIITGFNKEDVTGHSLLSYIAEDFKELAKKVFDDAHKDSNTSNFELPILVKDEQQVMLLLNATTRRNADGDICGVWFIGQNVTEMIQYREELRQQVKERTRKLEESLNKQKELTETLKEALAKEKELRELKSGFVSMVSHEFRTPLSAILAASGMLKHYGTRMTDQQKLDRLNKIEVEVRHMTQLLEDILFIGKIESGKLEFNPSFIVFENLIKDLIQEVELLTFPGKIKFSYNLEGRQFKLDEKLMKSIITNLLSNSIKYSPENSQIIFKISNEDKNIVFVVKDKGIGIPKEDLGHIFEPFHRAKNVGNISGTGLGLALVKEAVNFHRGIIDVDSEMNHGTTFTIKIPMIKEE